MNPMSLPGLTGQSMTPARLDPRVRPEDDRSFPSSKRHLPLHNVNTFH